MFRQSFLWMASLAVLFTSLWAQDPAPKLLSPLARLTSAQTAYLKNAGGSELPFNVISEGVEGWGRYRIVNAPEKSDIIIEVTSPDAAGGVSVSGTTSSDPHNGMPVESATTTRELSVSRITLIVYDAKSKMALWSGSEQPKGAMRAKARKDNIVQASERLVTKFREHVEPEAAK